MPTYPFLAWRPDEPPLGSSGVPLAKNCISAPKGYGPLPGLGNSQGNGLAETPLRVQNFVDNTGTVYVFVFAGADIYRLNAATFAFESVGRVIGYSTPIQGSWCVEQWGDRIYAGNYYDQVQYFDMGLSTRFADLPGAEWSPRSLAILRQFMIGAQIMEDTSTVHTPYNYRVRWCAFGNPNDWVVNPKTTQASFWDIPGLGPVKGITGGEFATVLLEDGVQRVEYIGGREIMQFDTVEGAPGCVETNSIIQVEGATYWLSPHGFVGFNGSSVFDIGNGKFDDWFETYSKKSANYRMSVVRSSVQHLIAWGFTGAGATGDKPNTLLLYNYKTGEATFADVDHDVLGYAASPGYTLDDILIALEDLPAPLDDPYWRGGARYVAAMDQGSLYGFNGAPLTAEIDTKEEFTGEAIVVHDAEVLMKGDGVPVVQVGWRDRANQQNPTWGPERPQEPSGIHACRDQGSYVRIKTKVTGTNWDRLIGVRVNDGGYR